MGLSFLYAEFKTGVRAVISLLFILSRKEREGKRKGGKKGGRKEGPYVKYTCCILRETI